MKIGYVRVSTKEQNIQRQIVILEEMGAEKVYVDKLSGKNTDRPQLKEMLEFIREGDSILVESISRLARNTRDLLQLVDIFTERGVGFVSQKESIDTATPTGKFILTVFGAIADLERSSILQRQAEGIAIAKANGVYKGRQKKQCTDFDAIYSEWKQGVISLTRALELSDLSKSTWYRRVREKQWNEQESTAPTP